MPYLLSSSLVITLIITTISLVCLVSTVGKFVSLSSPNNLVADGSKISSKTSVDVCTKHCHWYRSHASSSYLAHITQNRADWGAFLTPVNFRDLATWVYGHSYTGNQLSNREQLDFAPADVATQCLQSRDIIHVLPVMLGIFFRDVYPLIQRPFVLVTGTGDDTVPGEYASYLSDPATKIHHWFGQNGDNSTLDTKAQSLFTHVPIGINPYEVGDALTNYMRGVQSSMITTSSGDVLQFKWYHHGRYSRDKWLLANFDVSTFSGVRQPLWDMACAWNHTVCVSKENGVSQYMEHMHDIFQHNSQYRFILAPRGNGLDSHRFWESLYLGVVPVVLSGPLDALYQDLPVLIVADWAVLGSIEYLQTQWQNITDAYRGKTVPKMHASYWRHEIAKQSNVPDERASTCRYWGLNNVFPS